MQYFEWFDSRQFMRVSLGAKQSATVSKDITEAVPNMIGAAAGDSAISHWNKFLSSTEYDILLTFTKSRDDFYSDLVKDVYEFMVLKKREVKFFQYLCTGYLDSSKFSLYSRIFNRKYKLSVKYYTIKGIRLGNEVAETHLIAASIFL